MSVFLAIDLDPAVRAQSSALIEAHRADFAAKWLRTDKLHCTLVFLGNPSAAQLALWAPKIDALARRHHPLTLRLEGAGTFVTARAPSVLWLGVGGDLPALGALQGDALATLGGEERTYLPHVTLARAQQPGVFAPLVTLLSDFVSSEFPVAHLSLYESNHETYRVLQQVPLVA